MRENNFVSLLAHIPGLDAVRAIESIGGSAALYQKLLSQIMRLTQSNIGEMDEFLREGNLPSFGVKAHGVKGSLRQAGFLRLAKGAEDLEIAAKAGDAEYCREHYADFRESMMHFREQIADALNNADNPDKTADEALENKSADDNADLNGYLETLSQARAAAEEFDSLLSAELLAPLAGKRFGGKTDTLIASAVKELELFRPGAALAYITELFDGIED